MIEVVVSNSHTLSFEEKRKLFYLIKERFSEKLNEGGAEILESIEGLGPISIGGDVTFNFIMKVPIRLEEFLPGLCESNAKTDN